MQFIFELNDHSIYNKNIQQIMKIELSIFNFFSSFMAWLRALRLMAQQRISLKAY